MDISSDIKDSLLLLAKTHNFDLLILFGSRAKGKSRENSDYDFAFLKYGISLDEEMNIFDEFDNIFKEKKYQLINLEKNHNPVLRKDIFFKGICLYEKKKYLFQKEKEYSYFDYVDYFYLLKPHKDRVLSGEL